MQGGDLSFCLSIGFSRKPVPTFRSDALAAEQAEQALPDLGNHVAVA
jgi:hypothetical protein